MYGMFLAFLAVLGSDSTQFSPAVVPSIHISWSSGTCGKTTNRID